MKLLNLAEERYLFEKDCIKNGIQLFVLMYCKNKNIYLPNDNYLGFGESAKKEIADYVNLLWDNWILNKENKKLKEMVAKNTIIKYNDLIDCCNVYQPKYSFW